MGEWQILVAEKTGALWHTLRFHHCETMLNMNHLSALGVTLKIPAIIMKATSPSRLPNIRDAVQDSSVSIVEEANQY